LLDVAEGRDKILKFGRLAFVLVMEGYGPLFEFLEQTY